jgi:acetyl-CoA carboxylase biotin carboxyl carrier protein
MSKGGIVCQITQKVLMKKVACEVSGNVWKVEVSVGQKVKQGDTLAIIESMKMEIPVEAPQDGVVQEVLVKEGEAIAEGDAVAVLQT